MMFLFASATDTNPTTSEIGTILLAIGVILLVVERGASLANLIYGVIKNGNGNSNSNGKNNKYVTKEDLVWVLERIEKSITNAAQSHKELSEKMLDKQDRSDKQLTEMRIVQDVLRGEIRDNRLKLIEHGLVRREE